MAKKTSQLNPELEKQISALLKTLDRKDPLPTLDERKQVLELAMKYEHLKIKSKGDTFGKGFEEDEDEGGGDEF